MKKIYIKRKDKINEDETNGQNTDANATDQNANDGKNQMVDPDTRFTVLQDQASKAKTLHDSEVAKLQEQIAKLDSAYNSTMAQIRTQVTALNKQLAAAGLPAKVLSESFNPMRSTPLFLSDLRFSKKLFESRKPESLVDELIKLLYSALQGANVSYAPVSYEAAQKELRSRARGIKTFLYNRTSNEWNSEIVPKNHWDEVVSFIKDGFKNSNKTEFHYSDSELERIMSRLEERFRKSDHFSWIFGNELNKK